MLTVGVDLGKRHSQFAVIDDTGKVIVSRKLPNRKAIVQTFLRSLPGTVGQVGCETCINTYWLVEVVEEIGLTIVVGHALHLRIYLSSRPKLPITLTVGKGAHREGESNGSGCEGRRLADTRGTVAEDPAASASTQGTSIPRAQPARVSPHSDGRDSLRPADRLSVECSERDGNLHQFLCAPLVSNVA